MNPALVISLVGSGGTKKIVGLVLATLVVILALPVMAVFSMGGSAVQFLANAPSAEAAAVQGFYMGGPVEGNTYAWGNCTYWVFAMRLWAGSTIPTAWGNANTWDDRALADGYEVNRSPAPGAVFQTDDGQWGHVAYVTNVESATGRWTISEMNAPNFNVVSTRTFAKESASSYKFIHTKIGAAPWTPIAISRP